jgi:putative RNA 2'-phosphotransferase
MNLQKLSKFISLILRHKPQVIGITLDDHGWAQVDELLAGINRSGTQHVNRHILDEIVRTDSKQRYSFSTDGKWIRANQGHSVPVDVELEKRVPPAVLFHGTGEKYVAVIQREGLKSMSRLYVHLSTDKETAVKVGRRHGKPVVFKIDAQQMAADGCVFYLSVNQVWLTKDVPVQYLEIL